VRSEQGACERLFADAYDLHELLTNRRGCDGTDSTPAATSDLSIATAAHNSARFPIVSPAGNLMRQNAEDKKLIPVAHVVDGGYFDNYGALTAYDLADTLRWEYDLFPFVLLITNDPSDAPDAEHSAPWFSQPPKPIQDNKIFASVVAAPLDTVLATRSGHGSTLLKLLRGQVDPQVYQTKRCSADRKLDSPGGLPTVQNRSCYGPAGSSDSSGPITEPCFAHIAVFPQKEESGMVKDVSLSWWLSKPVQNYLDAQLNVPDNLAALNLVCAITSRGSGDANTDQSAADLCRNRVRKLTDHVVPSN
jgi:hypothetical protein